MIFRQIVQIFHEKLKTGNRLTILVQQRAHRWRYERRRPPSSLLIIFLIKMSKIIKKRQFKGEQLAEALVTIFIIIKVSRTK